MLQEELRLAPGEGLNAVLVIGIRIAKLTVAAHVCERIAAEFVRGDSVKD